MPGPDRQRARAAEHMILFNRRGSHALMSFVAQRPRRLLRGSPRAALECIDVGMQAHAVPRRPVLRHRRRPERGKLHRIATDYHQHFALETTFDLANCTTPSGASRTTPLRDDNAPICPRVDAQTATPSPPCAAAACSSSTHATPMKIVAEYDRTTIRTGCGGQIGDKMYVNSGGGTAANLSEFDVYAFDVVRVRNATGTRPVPRFRAPICRPRSSLSPQDDRDPTDSHGAVLTGNGRYLWVADRLGRPDRGLDLHTRRTTS